MLDTYATFSCCYFSALVSCKTTLSSRLIFYNQFYKKGFQALNRFKKTSKSTWMCKSKSTYIDISHTTSHIYTNKKTSV